MFRHAVRLLWVSMVMVVATSTGCRSLDTIRDPFTTVSLHVGETLRLGAAGRMVISLARVDQATGTAHFRVHDSVEAAPGAPVEFEGDCREGNPLEISPDLRRGYCRLVRVEGSSVSLYVFGATAEDVWVER